VPIKARIAIVDTVIVDVVVLDSVTVSVTVDDLVMLTVEDVRDSVEEIEDVAVVVELLVAVRVLDALVVLDTVCVVAVAEVTVEESEVDNVSEFEDVLVSDVVCVKLEAVEVYVHDVWLAVTEVLLSVTLAVCEVVDVRLLVALLRVKENEVVLDAVLDDLVADIVDELCDVDDVRLLVAVWVEVKEKVSVKVEDVEMELAV
jgi:hypothetical protein